MLRDLSRMLDTWPFTPGTVSVRRIKARDGSNRLQVRVDLGVLQMHEAGRPDGKKPLGYPSWFHALTELLQSRVEPKGSNVPVLSLEECARLHQETLQFNHRSFAFFHLKAMKEAAADCRHNLAIFDLLHVHAPAPEVAWTILQIAPQQILLLAKASAASLRPSNHDGILAAIDEASSNLASLFQRIGRPEWANACHEAAALRHWRDHVVASRPVPESQKLDQQLADAIQREDYELAARLRDQIRRRQEG